MRTSYEVFDISIPTYGTMILIGLILGVTVSYLLAKKHQPEFAEDVVYSFLYGIIGVGIGGKLLYILVGIPNIIKAIQLGFGLKLLISWLTQGGFVFYGSLIGGFIMILIYSRQFSVSLERILFFISPAVPLIHSFGRIGCLGAGCCYGIPSEHFGYQLNHSEIAPPGIKLFPTQLLESIYCFILFLILLYFFNKFKNGFRLLSLYVFLYSPFRFIIEFFRGDVHRGFIGILSTSQIISLLLIILASYFTFTKYKKNSI